jgi:phosphoglycerate dehydrogenase-like enzyme
VTADRNLRVGIAFPIDDDTVAAFKAASPRLTFRVRQEAAQAAVDEVAADDLDALIAARLPSDLARTPSLRWMQVLSAGVENLVGPGATRAWPSGIELTNARGVYAVPIAQYTIGAILRIAERVDARNAQQALGAWPADQAALGGRQVRGSTLVIVGYGGIGREIARLAAAFGIRVIAVKANPSVHADDGFRLAGTGDPDGSVPERIVGLSDLPAVAREADFMSITLPLTNDSGGVVSRDVIAALPAHAWLINTGRGPVVDEVALDEALAAGRLGGAVLDVFVEEPLPASSPLWRRPNVVITPHVSGSGGEDAVRALVTENLRRFVAGEPLRNRVHVERGY